MRLLQRLRSFAVLALIAVSVSACGYNVIPTKQEAANAAWAEVKELQDAQNALSGALGRLLAVIENYPDLKSNQNFLALQSQLEGTENRIAVARRDYIASVQDFNTTLRTFPSVLWAQTVFRSIKPLVTFTADSEAQAAPKVKF